MAARMKSPVLGTSQPVVPTPVAPAVLGGAPAPLATEELAPTLSPLGAPAPAPMVQEPQAMAEIPRPEVNPAPYHADVLDNLEGKNKGLFYDPPFAEHKLLDNWKQCEMMCFNHIFCEFFNFWP